MHVCILEALSFRRSITIRSVYLLRRFIGLRFTSADGGTSLANTERAHRGDSARILRFLRCACRFAA